MSNTRRLMFISLVVLLAMLLPVNQDFSQGATSLAATEVIDTAQAATLECGSLLSDTISAAGEVDQFIFSGQTEQVIDLTLVQTAGFDAFRGVLARFTLLSPTNMQLGAFDANTQQSFKLMETGIYLVRVNANNLFHTGSYNLGLECRQPLGPVDGTLNCGSLLSGKIEAPGEVDLITFSGLPGQVIDLTLVQTTGFDSFRGVLARFTLFSPTGVQLGAFDANRQQPFTLPEAGIYLVRINANNLFHTGSYNLGLECRQPLGPVDGALICNGPVRPDTIAASGEVDLITFSGQAGQMIDLTLVQTAGFDSFRGVLARFTLFSPTNVDLGAFDANTQQPFKLMETGTYLVRVNANNLFHTGSYNLGLLCLPPSMPMPITLTPNPLIPNPLTIPAGTSGMMTATISAAQTTATLVMLSSSNPNVARVPASVMIPAGATSNTFQVMGVNAGAAIITATLPATILGGASARASVTVQPPPCLPNTGLPSGFRPFSRIYYITGPNAAGDRLVVGEMLPSQLNMVPMPSQPDQRFCDPVELAPGLLAIAYVPTSGERNGDFSAFANLLLDPVTNMPFPNGIIPANRLGNPHAWRIVNQVGMPALVSAASYSAVEIAVESIAAIFGARLATGTEVATSLPLPTVLAGSTVKVRDSAGVIRDAPLFFVSPDQINFQVPPGTMNGPATATITSGNGSVSIGTAWIARVASGLFAANATGKEAATGVALRVRASGEQVFEQISRFDPAQNKFVPVPIDLGPATDQVFLILFGTGVRFRSSLASMAATIGGVNAEVLYAGQQADFVGLDQINLRLPRALAGRGEVDVVLTADGKTANTVRVNVK